ncbi:hydantoinase/oxoprolinase family protein [Cryobacterium levicorallinum]|uniref:Hydantoinase/oxoprolinase family protein n=3 Tax=Microbacteriaceae TaxID=85023 RepID=A0A1I2XY06_9MICO|nr:hydantoinase/oxoprolinase family protein [Cryobacterium levicorallinum]TFD22536.1 hydantoinase/oxoprolinase family protein [Cryobacterium sp. TMS1-13-1]TFD62429.1 hydantoinase/oxoprolinase family protein [Cryobacterium sp. Hh38]SFH18343.1 N-methylhydantoinase A [Cryobacterium levicorallinum]
MENTRTMKSQLVEKGDYAVGVDVGGTHTDLVLSGPNGLVRSKSFTTHGDYSVGIFNALELAANQLGQERDEVLAQCHAFINGSTIVTNAITELRGAKVGVLITRGFKDTFRLASGARRVEYDDHLQTPPPDVVARDCIEEISERVMSNGEIAVPLDEVEVRAAVRRLRDNGVEAIAICYLWSFSDGTNEKRTREIVLEEIPGIFITLSSEVHPVVGEYPRFMTAVFNCLSHRATTRYVEGLQTQLGNAGFTGTLTFFQGIGGSVGAEAVQAKPVTLMQSGPAGGVMGARHAAARLGLTNIFVGDMGGTSFDTAVLPNLEPSIAKQATFGPFHTGINMLDIVSVGAGGGSVAWLDGRGVPQVGPHSAGSEPGPACYGRGGTEPTVTDANVILGLIDPGNYLNGRHQLSVADASAAVKNRIGDPLGWDVKQAAAGIYDLAVIEMANALRVVSIERGHHPRDFTFFSYGGGLGLFAVEICRRLGCPSIVIPDNSSAFSAYGVLIADYVRQYEQTVNWDLSDPSQADRINEAMAVMLSQAKHDAGLEGIAPEDLSVERSGDFRFLGQTYEVTVPLQDVDFVPADAARLAEDFPRVYERNYGEGTAWKGSPVVLMTLSTRVIHHRPKPTERQQAVVVGAPTPQPVGERSVFLPSERRDAVLPIYAEADLIPGAVVNGPCIVDVGDTTIYVPEGSECGRDQYFNFTLTA